MCNLSTPYHAACAHYGRSRVDHCIKALAQPGHSRGCDELADMGVENAQGLCSKCFKHGIASQSRSSSVLSLSLSLASTNLHRGRRDSGYSPSISSGCSRSSSGTTQTRAEAGNAFIDSPPGLRSTNRRESHDNALIPSTAVHISRAEAAACARSLLASLPSSIPIIRRNASGVGLPSAPPTTGLLTTVAMPTISRMNGQRNELSKSVRSNSNMHWRAFDERAFGDDGLLGV